MVDKIFNATKAFIENSSGEVLLLKESKEYEEGANAGKWDVPGGRIEKGQHFRESLEREIEEEAGIEAETGEPFFTDEWRPEVKGEQWQIVGTYFRCETDGEEIELSKDHEEYAWIRPEDFRKYNLIGGLEKAFETFLEQRRSFRAAGKAVIINSKGLILVLKRSGKETHLENLWDVPGGRFEYGEKPQQGLKREVKEESGLAIQIIEPVTSWTFTQDNGEQVFGTTFLCEPEDIQVNLGYEHTDFQWVKVEKLEDLEMHDELREGLKKAHKKWRKDRELPKLVRDRIPEIIEENSENGEFRGVEGPELERFMREKVLEEAKEFTEDGQEKELADLLEVIDAYIENEGLEQERIEDIRYRKNSERGGFEDGLVLEDVE